MKKTILVIEDNTDIRENIEEILLLAGYGVTTAADGREGVAKAMAAVPDLVLSDIMMPEMDGYDVLQELQKHQPTSNIPFIFITAKSERPDMRRGMELGADDYLTKPFDDAELLSAVEARFKKQKIQQEFYSKALVQLSELVSQKKGLDEFKETIAELSTDKFRKKETIYDEGDRIKGFYLIVSGRVKTVRLNDEGRDLVTGIYEKDDFVAINMLFSNAVHTDSAVAIEDCELAFFPRKQCEELISKYPDIAGKFIRILSNEIHSREEHLLQLAYRSVRQRIAEALMRYAKQVGIENGIGASRGDLAAMSGTAPETVSRTLTDFADEGLLEKKNGLVYIKSLRGLEGV